MDSRVRVPHTATAGRASATARIARSHASLLFLVREFMTAITAGATPGELRRALDRIESLLQLTFDAEERQLAAHERADIPIHQAMHRRVLREVAAARASLVPGTAYDPALLGHALDLYVIHHVRDDPYPVRPGGTRPAGKPPKPRCRS